MTRVSTMVKHCSHNVLYFTGSAWFVQLIVYHIIHGKYKHDDDDDGEPQADSRKLGLFPYIAN